MPRTPLNLLNLIEILSTHPLASKSTFSVPINRRLKLYLHHPLMLLELSLGLGSFHQYLIRVPEPNWYSQLITAYAKEGTSLKANKRCQPILLLQKKTIVF